MGAAFRTLLEHRQLASCVLAAVVWALGMSRVPFPTDRTYLLLIEQLRPHIFLAIRSSYALLWFTTPLIAFSSLLSLAYIFLLRRPQQASAIRLPCYPDPAGRHELFVVVGEVHRAQRAVPVARPTWLQVPERGLFTGIAVFGAIGSGKTTGCMYPFAEQILSYRRRDPDRRPAALVLEVKGDFCYRVREILDRHGRADDYVELSLDCEYRYNPLHNDLEAYALAYGIASLLTNLFGRGKEPFWQQAYTNLVKFIILLHKAAFDYVTLFDVYDCAINPDRLAARIEEAGKLFAPKSYVVIDIGDYTGKTELEPFKFKVDPNLKGSKALASDELIETLKRLGIAYELVDEYGPESERITDSTKREQFEAVRRWFEGDWMRIEPKLRTSIVEGISVFLSLFDDNPAVKRTFCPPKECYDPVANADGIYGEPLPSFADLIERGTVVALNLPVSANPGLARAIGTFLKQDFQRSMLGRIPKMARAPERHWREVLFLCDEYHSFATVGESDPSGDEKFFALSRQAKCIPIVATQSISSLRSALQGDAWRTLLQTFRTRIFLTLSDDFSANVASDLCGKEEQLRENYTMSENSHDARVSLFSGRTTSHKSSVSTSKGYNLERVSVFEPKVFAELKNAQAIVLAYDGLNPLPPTYCYLKPYYLDPNRSYFEQLARGEI